MATLESIEAQLTSLTIMVTKHVSDDDREFDKIGYTFAGQNGNPGVMTRIDRIEQREANRSRHLWAIWIALVTSLIGIVFSKIAGVL